MGSWWPEINTGKQSFKCTSKICVPTSCNFSVSYPSTQTKLVIFLFSKVLWEYFLPFYMCFSFMELSLSWVCIIHKAISPVFLQRAWRQRRLQKVWVLNSLKDSSSYLVFLMSESTAETGGCGVEKNRLLVLRGALSLLVWGFPPPALPIQ